MTGEQITGYRETLGYTQTHMAGVLGICHTYLSKWESEKHIPAKETIEAAVRNLRSHCEIQIAVLQSMAEKLTIQQNVES